MGLDVHLYRITNAEDVRRRKAEYERRSEETWARLTGDRAYEVLSDSEKEEARSATAVIAAELGLDEWGEDKTQETKVEINSIKHPEHLFKIGYFRSSYNRGGINSILSDRIGVNLSDIMGAGDEYEFRPDWVASAERARKALSDFRAYLNENGRYQVMEKSINIFNPRVTIQNAGDAMKVFAEERKRRAGISSPFGDDWYSNALGTFGGKPLHAVAIMIGNGLLGTPTAYVVYESEDFDWYEQALEIVAETCEWVLAQEDPQNYYLHWSS